MEIVLNIANNVTYIDNVKFVLLVIKIILEQKRMIMKKLNVVTHLLMDIITIPKMEIHIFINV